MIDFERIPGVSRDWTLEHVRGDKQTFINEIQEAGFELVAERTIPGFQGELLSRISQSRIASGLSAILARQVIAIG